MCCHNADCFQTIVLDLPTTSCRQQGQHSNHSSNQILTFIERYCIITFGHVCFNPYFNPPTDFIPTLRTLLGHPVYLIYLCVTIIQLNSLIGMVTYKPKYIEQHFRQSASKANFLMGMAPPPLNNP